MNKETLELRRLIYGQSGVIVVDSEPKEMIKQIELIKSSTELDGFIFRPAFANTEDLTAYTDRDWMAMAAQYSLSYGWSNRFTNFSGLNAYQVLDQYFNDVDTDHKFERAITISAISVYQVEPSAHYRKVMNDIATSKTVLREQQIRILKLLPVAEVEKTYDTTKIAIKETEILIIKRLMDSGSDKFSFRDPDQIVRFVVNAFNASEPVEGQLTKTILKGTEVKIPTKYKKIILRSIDKMAIKGRINTAKQMLKYSQFWKRLYKQLAYTSLTKMTKRFPDAFMIRKFLYENNLKKSNTNLEEAKTEGNYEHAFILEMKNPGQMLRNLLQYMRYEKGDYIARKQKLNDRPYTIASQFEQTLRRKVHVDAFETFESPEFYETLLKTNTKLLWQVLTMIKDENLHKEKTSKKMNGIDIRYSIPLPGLNPKAVDIVKKQIKNAIKQIKREENSSLGNIYLDKSVKDFSVQFTGRSDTSISISGEYMPTGTKKNLSDLLEGKSKDSLIRIGLAWRGAQSCDIDLSMNVDNQRAVYYGRPILEDNNENIVMSSSGDITSNSHDIFSTELIDVDINLIKKNGIKWMFNSAIMYSGSTFDQYEAYWFMKVIKREDRIVTGRKMKIKLDEMDFATQITEPAKGMVGLRFTFGKKDEVEVINMPIRGLSSGASADMAEEIFNKALSERAKALTIGKALKMSINKQQFVDDIQFADIVISDKEPEEMKEGAKFLHPGKDNTTIQELIF